MQDDARGIDDRTQRVAQRIAQLLLDRRAELARSRQPVPSSSSEPAAICLRKPSMNTARGFDRRRVTEALRQRLHGSVAQQFVDGRQQAEEVGLGRHGWISVGETVSSFKL